MECPDSRACSSLKAIAVSGRRFGVSVAESLGSANRASGLPPSVLVGPEETKARHNKSTKLKLSFYRR
jgi:hypothetical protein